MAKYVIDIETKKHLATKALKWCGKNIGINKRKKLPKISVRIKFNNNENSDYGVYYWEANRIVINGSLCKSMIDVVSTVIHEYTHYLQSMRKYYEYFNTHYYSTHPYEKEAHKMSKLYTKRCLNNIKKLI